MNTIPSKRPAEVEITQAQYYTSALYPEPMTVEYINGAKPNRVAKRGQVPPPLNQWQPFDVWYTLTNNWFHRYNDKYQFRLFNFHLYNGASVDWQPAKISYFYSPRSYDDDIIGQTAAGVAIGLQIGLAFGFMHTFNSSKEAGVFQCISMPPNRWLPLWKANFAFRRRIWATCMLQASTFLGSYQFVEACWSQMRGKDDFWNQIVGGIACGCSLSIWFRNFFYTIPLGTTFGIFMMTIRYMVMEEGALKPCLDLNRPGWGVIGGVASWIHSDPPNPGRFWYTWMDTRYRFY